MRNRIPECRTWSVNNKCTWALYSRERNIDNNLEVTRDWNDTQQRIITTEPQSVSIRDNAILQQSAALGMSETVSKIWVKDLIVDFSINDYSLQNIERKTPYQEDLTLFSGFWNILTSSDGLGFQREQWIFIVKQN